MGYIEQGVNFFAAGERFMLDRHYTNSGEIRLASTDTICKYFLLSKIKDFYDKYPKVKFSIMNRTSPKCLELLKNGDVDVAVMNVPSDLNKSVFTLHKNVEFKDIFIVSENWQQQLPTNLAELSKAPLISLDSETVTRRFFNQLFLSKKIHIVPEIEMGSVDLLVEMTKAGLGIGFAPDYCIKDITGIRELNIKEQVPPRNIGVAVLSNLPQGEVLMRFVDTLNFL